jgi:Tfp pilus assembly protein PilO
VTIILTWLRSFALGHWLLICALVAGIGWHYADRHAAVEAERATWQTRIEDAKKEYQADHDAQQSKLDALAKATNPELARKFDRISQQLSSLGIDVKHPPKVFVPECVMPDEQVAAYNGIGK